jgi:hypothetical protein
MREDELLGGVVAVLQGGCKAMNPEEKAATMERQML